MNEYIFSPGKNAFYPLSLQSEYEGAGTWPDDGVPVSVDVCAHFSDLPPDGKIRGVDNGLPAWVDKPAPSREEQIAATEFTLKSLRADADAEIVWRKDAVDVGIATDQEASQLVEWIKYRVLLMRIDPAEAPNINLPPKPVKLA